MSDNAIIRKSKCRFGCRCLIKDARQPLCSVKRAIGENHMFVNSEAEITCPYRIVFGDAEICSCPTHYALHRKIDQFD
jgi:hypothetical protein